MERTAAQASSPPGPPTLRSQLRALRGWSGSLSYFLPGASAMALGYRCFGGPRMDRMSHRFAEGLMRATGSRMHYHVAPEIRPDEPYIFVQNHVNHFDFVVSYAATPHFKQGIELVDHFSYPIYGAFMRHRGTIPVVRSDRRQIADLRQRVRLQLEAGNSILAFPEGTRTLDGQVGPFRKGLFTIARDLRVRIVPIAVAGSYALMHKGSLRIEAGHDIHVHCDAPMDTVGLDDRGVTQLMKAARTRIIARLAEHS